MTTFAESVTVTDLDRDPYPIYARLREESPVAYVPAVGLWFVTRHADVEFGATHPELFAAKPVPSPVDRTFGEDNILTLDGAPQRELRSLLDPSFRPRVIEASSPALLEPIVHGLLDRVEGSDRAELMADLFEPVSVLGLARIMGIGEVDAETLRRWFAGLAAGATNFEEDAAKQALGDATCREIDARLAPICERLHAEPDGSMIANLLEAADGSLAERVARMMPTIKVIILGGMQEPGHGCGSTTYGLLTHAGQAEAMRADPAGCVRRAVEEGLRWIAPIGTQTRRVTRDVELGGVTIPAGANVGLLVSSANRDAAVYGATADLFDLDRPRTPHAAFGFGPHFCVGHHFTRVQMRLALEQLFTRFPRLRLDPHRPAELRGWEFRAPARLPVVLGR